MRWRHRTAWLAAGFALASAVVVAWMALATLPIRRANSPSRRAALDALSRSVDGLTLVDLAAATGLSRSHLFVTLATLAADGRIEVVVASPDHRYRLI